MKRFQILPGLAAEGPPPIGFPAQWGHDAREGFVVQFQPKSGEVWVGNFEPGAVGISGAFPHPNARDVVVMSGGDLWEVRPETREASKVGVAISGAWKVPESSDFVFERQGLAFLRIGARGLVWHTRRVSWDGFRNLRVDSLCICGEAWSPDDEWCLFNVHIETGFTEGGSYNGPAEAGWELLASRIDKVRPQAAAALDCAPRAQQAMRTIPYWIQRADFTVKEYGAVDSGRAVQALLGHDWSGEWRLAEERAAEELETCDPGIGFLPVPGHVLHICPIDEQRALVHYHFTERRHWLGFIPVRVTVARTNSAVSPSELSEFIRRFYDDDHRWLVDRTNAT